MKLWHWEQARYPWLLLRCLVAPKGVCPCQAMEQQTRQSCLNLDISGIVSEEIKPVRLKGAQAEHHKARTESSIRSPLPPAFPGRRGQRSSASRCPPGLPKDRAPGRGGPRGERGRAGAAGRENKGAGEGRPGPGPAGGTAARVFPLN